MKPALKFGGDIKFLNNLADYLFFVAKFAKQLLNYKQNKKKNTK